MISLYFHIPFCSKKCPYCHFYVIPNEQNLKNLFLPSLQLEWQQKKDLLKNHTIVSIYFGGGTPILLGPEAIEKILDWIQRDGSISSNCEITIEANPESVTLPLMQKLKIIGINRVSIGVQSFQDSLLQDLGRTHNSQEAKTSIETTFFSGIENISIDLMYDLPNQSLTDWETTLHAIENLPISHLSLYNLTIEPNTLFFKKKKALTPLLPNDRDSLQMVLFAETFLGSKDFSRYEISAFAKKGFHSCHNTGYWTGRPFLGFGPSAFSYWEKKRFSNISSIHRYADLLSHGKNPIDFEECLPYPNDVHELFAVQLRLVSGVDLEQFEKKHLKLPLETMEKLSDLIIKRWIEKENSVYRLTREGRLFYDSVAAEII